MTPEQTIQWDEAVKSIGGSDKLLPIIMAFSEQFPDEYNAIFCQNEELVAPVMMIGMITHGRRLIIYYLITIKVICSKE